MHGLISTSISSSSYSSVGVAHASSRRQVRHERRSLALAQRVLQRRRDIEPLRFVEPRPDEAPEASSRRADLGVGGARPRPGEGRRCRGAEPPQHREGVGQPDQGRLVVELGDGHGERSRIGERLQARHIPADAGVEKIEHVARGGSGRGRRREDLGEEPLALGQGVTQPAELGEASPAAVAGVGAVCRRPRQRPEVEPRPPTEAEDPVELRGGPPEPGAENRDLVEEPDHRELRREREPGRRDVRVALRERRRHEVGRGRGVRLGRRCDPPGQERAHGTGVEVEGISEALGHGPFAERDLEVRQELGQHHDEALLRRGGGNVEERVDVVAGPGTRQEDIRAHGCVGSGGGRVVDLVEGLPIARRR